MDKFTATNVLNKRRTADRMARINDRVARAEKQLDAICRKRGANIDTLTRNICKVEAKALDTARMHLSGKEPGTTNESNHLTTLAAKLRADDRHAQMINEANAQRGFKGMIAQALAAMK